MHFYISLQTEGKVLTILTLGGTYRGSPRKVTSRIFGTPMLSMLPIPGIYGAERLVEKCESQGNDARKRSINVRRNRNREG